MRDNNGKYNDLPRDSLERLALEVADSSEYYDLADNIYEIETEDLIHFIEINENNDLPTKPPSPPR